MAAKRAAARRLLGQAEPPVRLGPLSASLDPRHNVVGVGAGGKITKGRLTGTPCIRLYVERKVERRAVPAGLLLPVTIEGFPTDVVETGRFVALPARLPVARRRLRPARPGCSMGFRFTGDRVDLVMAGTFGAVVQADGRRCILSNNHVLADENNLPVGSPVFQPGVLDGGSPARDRIATLTRFIALARDGPNSVDAALAEVLDPRAVRAAFLPKVGRLGSASPVRAVEGMRVHKHGRTTGYTTGRVFDASADVTVRYEMGVLAFEDQVLIQGDRGMFSDSGDSGSVIVDRATKRAAALLFAGSRSYTIANRLSEVLSRLGVAMVV